MKRFFSNPNSTIPPCVRFGLDINKLQNEKLLKMRTYRRLYNIVSSDKTSSIYEFRPNLIKQLYFLLQITPFIEDRLQENFLTKIQEWYNSNDHKKINLSRNLQSIMENIRVTKNKTKHNIPKRPKSGVEWDTSINPFLRPYTAKLKKNKQNTRPQSSKFEMNSTMARTSDIKAQKTDFVEHNEDIEEEWERSQDFMKKHRTVHPEEEPTFQKLINLIQKADNKQFIENSCLKETNKFCSNFRRPKTGINKYESENKVLEREKSQENIEDQINEPNENAEFGCQYSEDQIPQQEESVHIDKKGIYVKDQRSKRKATFKENLLGMKVFGDFTEKQYHPLNRLYKINYFENQKKVIAKKDDDEYLKNHLQFTKHKNFMKKELTRRTQSKRLLQYSKKRQVKKQNNFIKQDDKTVNIQECEENKEENEPFYNEKQYFQDQSKQNLRRYYKVLGENSVHKVQNQEQVMTKYERFISEKKFNPLHKNNIETYNTEVLSQIERIKQNLGPNNCISTNSLMKALYVDAPMHSEPAQWQTADKRYLMIRKQIEKKKKKKKKKILKHKKK